MSVEKRVFKNLELFTQNKSGEDDLFDRLNVSKLQFLLIDICFLDGVGVIKRCMNKTSCCNLRIHGSPCSLFLDNNYEPAFTQFNGRFNS